MPKDTISPEAGKRYLTRQRGTTGTVREAGAGLEGHFTDGTHYWDEAGMSCPCGTCQNHSSGMFDLIKIFH